MSIRQVKRLSLTLYQQDQRTFFSRTMESFEMIIMSFVVISMITIVASAVVSAYVNVSRERLWVRAAKAEELYMAIEETHTSMTAKVAAALNLPESRFLSADSECQWAGISCINECVTEIEFEENNLVGKYSGERSL